ncbi:CD63 antigen [Folsomia candida]|uniref:Tetraspanin n=1 Tax=Folsomia candida TaxID=158441 RepID=A0A226F4H3_FOLCA|nr:CD63 antigen [Folsomia candida]XP_035703270.1 CD63 antigen [Folsomia candida]OXA64683.1 CD63 antigen [Folsomia candida]
MVSGGVNKCMKYALFVFNLVFVIVGIVMVWLGISSLNGFDRYIQLVETHSFAAPPKLFIAIGVIMFLIAFLGCCGAWMENHAMIMAYSVLVGLVLVLQLGVGIAAFLLQDDVEQLAEKGLNSTLVNYYNKTFPNVEDIQRSWNLVQSELHCCGVSNYTDWKASYNADLKTEALVPTSCCVGGAVENCTLTINKDNIDTIDVTGIIYTEGCLNKAIDQLAITRLGVVAIALGVVQLLGVICACLLARSIRFSYETV